VGATQGAGNLLFVLFALRLPGTVSGLASHFLSLPGLSTQLGRLLEPLETPEQEGADATGALEPGPAAISLRGVRVEAAGHRLLEVEALDIAAGEAIAIVGASGAGKSTLLGLLQGWHRPSVGLVTVNGSPLTPARVTALRARTAWVDPAVALWSRSLLDNLRYGDEGAVVDEGKVLEIAQLRPLLGRLPDGLATVAGEGGAGFSGGEGQRLRVGRGLRRPDPALVLLDEAFRGLDRPSRRRMAAEALARWQGATILMVSHDLDSCRAFPRVLVIEGGRIVEDGAPADLLTQGGAFARLVSAEADLQSQRWTDPAWRRWRVGEGRVTS
jgi:ATP-binding cassette subfamily B protein